MKKITLKVWGVSLAIIAGGALVATVVSTAPATHAVVAQAR